tara:strand:- start:94 stop:681 length:588 start_codon:yes stop_codon:yes gene_type:complete
VIARLLLALAVTVALAGYGERDARAANSIEVTSVTMEPAADENGWQLSADFYLPISNRIKDVLDLGVPLYFVVEFQLTASRWYWADRILDTQTQKYRLSYHPITRRFRLSRSGYPQEFIDVDDALASLSRIRGWSVLQDVNLQDGETYEAALRMRLDASQLPGPLQIDALNNQDWNLDAPWKRFRLTPGIPTRTP